MGEQPLRELITLIQKGVPFSSIKTVAQTAFLLKKGEESPKNKNWNDVTIESLLIAFKEHLKL